MTPNDFRKLALSFPETEERRHMNHPDFRVAGKSSPRSAILTSPGAW